MSHGHGVNKHTSSHLQAYSLYVFVIVKKRERQREKMSVLLHAGVTLDAEDRDS